MRLRLEKGQSSELGHVFWRRKVGILFSWCIFKEFSGLRSQLILNSRLCVVTSLCDRCFIYCMNRLITIQIESLPSYQSYLSARLAFKFSCRSHQQSSSQVCKWRSHKHSSSQVCNVRSLSYSTTNILK